MHKNKLTQVQKTVAVVAIVSVVVVCFSIMVIELNMKSEAWAAWVQAIFSIVAIATAIWIPHSERKSLVLENLRQEREAIISIIIRMEWGLRNLSEVIYSKPHIYSTDIPDSPSLFHAIEITANWLERLESIKSPSPVLMKSCLMCASILREELVTLSRLRPSKNFNAISNIKQLIKDVETHHKITAAEKQGL